ncbi:hypothetical protein FRC10_004146 [Ceratobasidium sp. 414]|nr:hypothetical protein FRC10_004146 [Ceratobasidium sp. 414]
MVFTSSLGLALVTLWAASAASANPSLTLRPASVSDVAALKITASLKNTGTETIRLLKDPNSLLSTWETDAFQVARSESGLASGPSLNFTGIRVKYSPAAAVKSGKSELFTIIEPGATVNVTHSLASTYDFTGKGGGAGKYKFKSSARARTFLSVSADGTIAPLEATETQVAEVSVSGRLSGPNFQPGTQGAAHGTGPFEHGKAAAKRALFRGCNDPQINDINSAADLACFPNLVRISGRLSQILARRSLGDETLHRVQWFGAWDQGRYQSVFQHYDNIRFNPPTFNYDCTCTDPGIYAYVIIPGHFKEVYLCGAFWNAPLEGTDSKAGTIIHEASHFPEYAGTSDYVYGQGGCRDLARNDPGKAAMNAE